MLRGEPDLRAELFARLLVGPGAPFLNGESVLTDSPSEVLARAGGGVLFIDDLTRLGRSGQRGLEFLLARASRHKARVVSFSSADPKTLVDRYEFDAGLVKRLAELTLRLPSLREFAEDVPDLAQGMLVQLVESRSCPSRRFSIAALNALRHHPWPGNLVELEAVVRDLAYSSLEEEVQLEDVQRALASRMPPPEEQATPTFDLDRPYREAREDFERQYFERLLASEGGSMSRVAERSGLERTHLYRKLKALGLQVGRREEA